MVVRCLTCLAWLTIVATAIASTWMMFGAIDDGNPNTRDGWMASWLLVVIPTGAVCKFWDLVFSWLESRRRATARKARPGMVPHDE